MANKKMGKETKETRLSHVMGLMESLEDDCKRLGIGTSINASFKVKNSMYNYTIVLDETKEKSQ